MYKLQNYKTNRLKGEEPFEAISLEEELKIATATKSPIQKNSITQCFYTQRKDGVLPECNIKTDRFEMAQEAMSHANNEFRKKIQERIDQQNKKIE